MRVALDSNILIYLFEDNPEYVAEATQLIIGGPERGVELHISEFTILELLSSPKLTDEDVRELHSRVLKLQYHVWPIMSAVLVKAAELRRSHKGLNAPDAIHLATAIVHKCDYFVTNDKVILSLKSLQGVGLIGLRNANNLKTD